MGDDSGLSRWSPGHGEWEMCQRRQGQSDAMLSALNMEEGPRAKERGRLQKLEKVRKRIPPPERNEPCQCLDFSPVRPMPDF